MSGVHLGPGSWDVIGDVKTDAVHGAYFCNHLDFALTVDGATMTLGRGGEMYSAPVQIVDGAYLATSVHLPKDGCNTDRFFVNELRLRGVDSDGDGEADQLEASVTLDRTTILTGDTGTSATVTIDLRATIDHSDPTLFVPSVASSSWDPLDFVTASASEPLDPAAELTLNGTSSVPLLADVVRDAPTRSPVIRFSTQQILPLGGTWQLIGQGKDLAGHALQVSGALSTFADPGVQAQDGFEGALTGVTGSASLVTGYGTIPALSGGHSLWLGPGEAFFHLQRLGKEKSLHLAIQPFGAPDVDFEVDVRAGVVGGNQVVQLTSHPATAAATGATGDVSFPWAGDARLLDAELDEPGKDVLLSVSVLSLLGSTNLIDGTRNRSPTAAMIDDVKLE